MALQLTDNERTRLILRGRKTAPQNSTDDQPLHYEGLWAGRGLDGTPFIRGWLHTVAFEECRVVAMVFHHGSSLPELRSLPDEEIVWFLRSPQPPGRLGTLAPGDPILDLPGESQAHRLRRVLRAPPLALVTPTELILRQPEFSVHHVVRSPNNRVMSFGVKFPRGRPTFVIEGERSRGLSEASAGFSLLWWWFQFIGTGHRQCDWDRLDTLVSQRSPTFLQYFDTYQALRLPGLRLALEYRASPLGAMAFARTFADTYCLPLALVERRLEMLHQHSPTLALE